MKYPKMDWGLMEAVVNKLGGMAGVRAFLSGDKKLEGQTREEEMEIAFLESYQKALIIRDFLRGWGNYGSKDGGSHFAIMVSDLTDRARNFSETAIRSNAEMEGRVKTELLDEIEAVKLKVVEFETREGIKLSRMWWLNVIKTGLRENDSVKVLEFSIALKTYISGLDELNDLLLAPAQKIAEEVRK